MLIGVSVLVGYGPSIAWCVFASRRYGTGHPLARLRRARPLGRPRVGSDHLAVDDARRRHRRAADQGARRALPQQPRRRRRRVPTARRSPPSPIAAIVVAPVVEEVIFRGVMLRGLSLAHGGTAGDRGPGRPCSASPTSSRRSGSDNIGLVIALGLVGVGFGIGCYLVRRIGPTIIAHALFNTAAVIIRSVCSCVPRHAAVRCTVARSLARTSGQRGCSTAASHQVPQALRRDRAASADAGGASARSVTAA